MAKEIQQIPSFNRQLIGDCDDVTWESRPKSKVLKFCILYSEIDKLSRNLRRIVSVAASSYANMPFSK